MKKILWLATNENPNFGGIELHSVTFVKAIKQRGFNVSLCLSKDNYVDKNTRDIEKCYVTTRYSFDLKAFKKIYEFTKKINPDVIIANNAKEYEIALVVSKLLRKKVIAFRHMENLKNPLVARLILSNMDIVYTVSEKLRQELLSKGVKEDKLRVLYNLVEEGNPKKQSKDKIKVLFVGKVIEAKGIWEFLHLAKELKPYQEFEFYVVGDGQELSKAKAFSEENSLNVNFVGFQKDVYPYYQIADVVLILSKYDEAMTRVAIEALANGCAVVGSIVGGIKEAIEEGKNGFLVNPTDIKAIKDAVLSFIDKNKLLEAQKYSYEIYKRKFSKEAILSKFEEDISNLI